MNLNNKNQQSKIVFAFSVLILLLQIQTVFAADPGKKDTLLIYPSDCNFTIAGFHDEPLSGFAVPFRYKTAQKDIILDSVKFHAAMLDADIKDTVIDREIGIVTVFAIWFDSLPPGKDTLFTLYFTPGPTWDPAITTSLDTFRLESGQGLSFTDVKINDIVPHIGPSLTFGKECFDFWQGSQKGGTRVPTSFFLGNNLPNPFNSETVISFGLSQPSQVTIEIFNILGQKVKILTNGQMPAGYHRASWDGKDARGKKVATGIYFYKMTAGVFSDIKKMSLVK